MRRELTFGALVYDVWMVLFREVVELEHSGVDVVVSNQKAVLFAFEPALSTRKSDGATFFANFVVYVVDIAHISLKFDRFFAHQLESRVSRRLEPLRDPRYCVDLLFFRKEAQFEVHCNGLLRVPVVQSEIHLPVDIVLYAREVRERLLLDKLLCR